MKALILLSALFLATSASAQVTSITIDSTKFNQPLKARLDSLWEADQTPRLKYLEARQKKESTTRVDSLRKAMLQQDHENLVKAISIMDKYGWQGPQKVGLQGSQALFLVIQHADLPTQKKYLPMFKEAEQKGEILSSNLAILEDRINVREGKKQLYGSQATTNQQTGKLFFYPIADLDHLEERRKRMGLPTMAEYAKLMNMEWSLEQYKKSLPELEKLVAKPNR
jgi:hypothetical protein